MEEENLNHTDREGQKFKINDRRHWVSDDVPTDLEPDEQAPSYVKQLRSEAEDKDKRLREYISAFKAKSSEFEELKQRLQRENETKLEQFKARLFSELLPIFDNLMRATEASSQSKNLDVLTKGIQMTVEQFKRYLQENGVTSIQAVGRKFDPTTDEACMTIPTDDPSQDNMVLEELEPGYKFGERLLRPVKVKVARST